MSAAQNSNRFYNLSTWKRRALLVTVVIAAFAMLAALAEGAVRVRAWVKYGNFKRVEDTYVFDAVSNLRIPRPGWTNGRIVINSQGFRSPEISEKRPSKSIRIAFLGASTTYCAEVTSNETTWPHLVAEELREYLPDITIEYINAGVPGYGVTHSLRALKHRVAKFEPNLIVIYHATNDLSGNSFEEAKRQGVVSRRSEEELSWGSNYSLLWYLVEKNLRIMALQQSADELQGKIELDSESLAAPFRSDLRQLVHASSLAAPLVAVVTFSTRLRADQSVSVRRQRVCTICLI
jgi:lysophospholipase L1-like esterase